MITKDNKTKILYAILISLAIALPVWFMLKTFFAVLLFCISLLILLNFETVFGQQESLPETKAKLATKPSAKSTPKTVKSKSAKPAVKASAKSIPKTAKSKSTKSKPGVQAKSMFTWPTLGEFNFEISGEENYQAALSKLMSGKAKDENIFTVKLVPEDDNTEDDRSVRIDINDMIAGYLRRDHARSFRRRLSAKKLKDKVTSCQAIIVSNQKKNYSVFLDIKPFM